MTDQAPERIGLIADGLGCFALAHRNEADVAVRYIRLDLHEAEVAKLRAERDDEKSQADAVVKAWAETSQSNYQRAKKAERDLVALRKSASSDYCAGFDAGFAASHENWNGETINRNDQREVDYLNNQREAALAAYRATKGGAE